MINDRFIRNTNIVNTIVHTIMINLYEFESCLKRVIKVQKYTKLYIVWNNRNELI